LLFNKIKQFWNECATVTTLAEGSFADQYTDPELRKKISNRYQQRFQDPGITPYTHPWQFDPLNPPTGWRYDPYYEMWISKKEQK
jgi:hypothetical protein